MRKYSPRRASQRWLAGALEYSAHDVANYRYANGHKRIRWQDLPDATRAMVVRFAESAA